MKYVTYSGVSLFNIFLFFPPGPFADKGLELLIYSFASNFKVASVSRQRLQTWNKTLIDRQRKIQNYLAPPSILQPPRLLLPGILLPSLALLAAELQQGGGTSCRSGLTVATPSSILLPNYPHPAHFIPSVHQYRSSEVGDVNLFSHLPIQAGREGPFHFHAVYHILPTLVVVQRIEPQDRFILLPCLKACQVLQPPGVAIPACLAIVLRDPFTTLVTQHGVCDTLTPAVTPSLSYAGKASWSPAAAPRPEGLYLLNFCSNVTPPFPTIRNLIFLPWLLWASFLLILPTSSPL